MRLHHLPVFMIVLASLTSLSFAHPLHGMNEGSGFFHPFSGVDHLFTALAIGLIIFREQRRKLLLPLAFLLGMSIGCAAGFSHYQSSLTEGGILLSMIILGYNLLSGANFPLKYSFPLLLGFGFFHGSAHGIELHGQGSSFLIAGGLLLATTLIHVLGLMIVTIVSKWLEKNKAALFIRMFGAGVAGIAVVLALKVF